MSKKNYFRFTLVLLILIMAVMAPSTVQAASFKNSRPTIAKNSAYNHKKVYLKWSGISGAKKYEIQRAIVHPSDGSTGKWRAWKETKKTYVNVTAKGDYMYRVRAIKGKEKSKWSKAKRIFAASAKVTHMSYVQPEIMFGVELRSGRMEFRVLVCNKSKSDMGFVDSGTRFGQQCTIYAVSKSTGKVRKKWEAHLDTTGIAKLIKAGETKSLYYYSFMTPAEWKKYKKYDWKVSTSFYPNPEVESISTAMAIGYTKNVAQSSIAGK